MNRANINSMIMMNSAQELVISLVPASGASVIQAYSQITASCMGWSWCRDGARGVWDSSARVPSGSVSSETRPEEPK